MEEFLKMESLILFICKLYIESTPKVFMFKPFTIIFLEIQQKLL